MIFIRFVVGTNQESARLQSGVVTELRLLKESGDLFNYQYAYVDELFEWLNGHMPCPPYEKSNWGRDAISWFKPSAEAFIQHFRDMIAILEEHGRFVRMLKTDNPGVFLYEDEFQIVARSNRF